MTKIRNRQTILNELGLNRADADLLEKYFLAFSNFYGKLSLKTAFEIINEQNTNKFSDDVLLEYVHFCGNNSHSYAIISPAKYYENLENLTLFDDEIIQDSLYSVDDECYYELDEAQENKPICVLPKDELLKYADESYREETPEALALEKYLEQNVKILQPPSKYNVVNTARDLVNDYILGSAINTGFDNFDLDFLLNFIEIPEDEEERTKLLNDLGLLITEVYNNTRMWANRGYTPKEMAELFGSRKARY